MGMSWVPQYRKLLENTMREREKERERERERELSPETSVALYRRGVCRIPLL